MKVIGFKIGELGFIITRKILLGVILSILMMVLLIYKLKYMRYHYEEECFLNLFYKILNILFFFLKVIPISDKWVEFKEVCGKNELNTNYQAMGICSEKYFDKTVINWNG